MCQFASFVLSIEREFWDSSESHETIIEHHGLHVDGARGPNVLRVEITPPDDSSQREDLSAWRYHVDQDVLPEWAACDPGRCEERARAALARRAAAELWFARVISQQAIAGYRGTATAGDHGTATAGDHGTATAGDGGTATAGDYGTATAGDRGTATAGYGSMATAGYGGTATAGDHGAATAGDYGTAIADDYGTATAGYRGTATAGDYGTATAGDYGTATAGSNGTATAGDDGTATAGDYGTATAGDRGTATAGYRGTATAGDGGEIRLRYWDSKSERYRVAVGYVGEGGIEPDVAYVVVDGQLARSERI